MSDANSALRSFTFGAISGLSMALSDFGAQWLWLDTATQRIALFIGLVGIQTGTGAVLGVAAATLKRGVLGLFPSAWPVWRNDSQATFLCALPAFLLLSNSLFSGASVANMPHRPLAVGGSALAGAALFGVCTTHILRLARHSSTSVRLSYVGFLASIFLCTSKADQWIYPGHYVGLHLALTLLSAFSIAGAATLLFNKRTTGPAPRAKWIAPVSIALFISIGLASAQSRQNVRVAMTRPRTSHTRSLAFALAPLLSGLDALNTRRSLATAHYARRSLPEDGAMHRHAPTLPDAHILLVTVDALRADHIGAYGYSRSTSRFIDTLAASGIRYERAYAQTPHSSHSLASLFTSEFIHLRTTLNQPVGKNTLPQSLNAAGYHTAAFFTSGIFHTDRHALADLAHRRFDFERYEDDLVDASETTQAALRETRRILTLGEPNTLLWAHYFNVHAPYEDLRFGDAAMDRYDGEIARVDEEIERLIAGVRLLLDRPVIVVLTADHGESFGEHGDIFHGSSLYEEQIRVPLILNAPTLLPAVDGAPAQLIDIAPTLLSLIGLSPPAGMAGRDLLSNDSSEQAMSSVNDLVALSVHGWKFIVDLKFNQKQLFNISEDPKELRNLVDEQPETAVKLQRLLDNRLNRIIVAPLEGQASEGIEKLFAQAALGDSRSVPDLLSIATSPAYSADRRAKSIDLLAELDASSAIPRLHALAQEHGPISSTAAVACGRLGLKDVLPTLKKLVEPSMGTRALNWLSRSPQPSQLNVALAIARLGDSSALDALLTQLDMYPGQGHEGLKRDIITALGSLGDNRAFSALAKRTLDPWVGYAAVQALGRLDDPRSLYPLLDALKNGPTRDIRNNAAVALGNSGSHRALRALQALSPYRVDRNIALKSINKLLEAQDKPGGAPTPTLDPIQNSKQIP